MFTLEFTPAQKAVYIGNVLEYFDFAVLGSLSDVFSIVFFDKTGSTNLLRSFSIYASAFMMRPIGGIAIGLIGDIISRRRALEISIACMIIPSFLIGILPTYERIGVTATIALSILRLMQGFAVGGELVGAWYEPLCVLREHHYLLMLSRK